MPVLNQIDYDHEVSLWSKEEQRKLLERLDWVSFTLSLEEFIIENDDILEEHNITMTFEEIKDELIKSDSFDDLSPGIRKIAEAYKKQSIR